MVVSPKTQLNPMQREAVETTEGPVLVLAGAGSGKTRVLTERIAYLISHKHVDPRNILAFTFTNKAAQEMRDRLEQRHPGISDLLWVGTFHRTGVRILRRHGDSIGIPRDFSIYDATDSLNLIKSIVSLYSLEGTILKSTHAQRETISRWKSDLITPQLAHERAANNIDRKLVLVYEAYEKELKRAKALDFDDLIAKVVHLFTAHPGIMEEYARRFRYVLVDEFQDTNPIQMMLIDNLSSVARNLFVVGDDDQSIYSWRGARVEHILNFENLYPGTRMIRLEQNYRSTKTILAAANHVIAFNRGRKGKSLWTEGDAGEKVKLLVSTDEEAEAGNILHVVSALRSSGHSLKDIAILYRTNAQSRSLEEVFKMGGIPYQIIGSVRFYERAEIRDLLAYCKLLVNPDDSINLKRVINTPRRAIGKTTFTLLEEQAHARDLSTMALLAAGDYALGPAPAKRVAAFVRTIGKLDGVLRREIAPRVIEAIIDGTGYRQHLKESYPDSESRIENIEELVAAAESFAEMNEDRSLRAFLEEIALVSDVDGIDEESGLLTLMTVHNAKGLEFDCIIIAGLEDGLFPHYSSLDRENELEEERRLFYVGMTRARRKLYLSYANMRRRMGSISGQAPSRFLFELPEEHVEGEIGMSLIDTGLSHFGSAPGMRTKRMEDERQDHPDYENTSQEAVVYAVGIKIFHEQFGRGIVRKIEGRGSDLRVTILFNDGSERKFIASYAPMRPV